MSKYSIGIDVGNGSDYTAYTITRGPNWWERLLRRLHLSKATWEVKIIKSWVEK